MQLSILISLSIGMLLIAATASFGGDGSVTAKEIAGTYEMVSGEKNGEKIPAEHIAGQKVKITEERIMATDKDSKETFSCTYKIDATKTPSVIKMVSTTKGHEGTPADGLIMFAGDTLQLIYTLPDGSGMPKKFKTVSGELMVTMKRIKASE